MSLRLGEDASLGETLTMRGTISTGSWPQMRKSSTGLIALEEVTKPRLRSSYQRYEATRT